MEQIIKKQLRESAAVKLKTARHLSGYIRKAAETIIAAYQNGNKLLVAGNGGSAADAQHIAAELVGKFEKKRKALPALALTTNTSSLTALGNDFGYATVFARQVEAFGEKDDVFIAISTSGESANLIRALSLAKKIDVTTIGLLGKGGGRMKTKVDIPIVVPSSDTQRVQETHITIGHLLCGLVESFLT